jgi:hypothetical protein
MLSIELWDSSFEVRSLYLSQVLLSDSLATISIDFESGCCPRAADVFNETPWLIGDEGAGRGAEVVRWQQIDIFDFACNIIGGGNDRNKRHVKTKEEAYHSLARRAQLLSTGSATVG